MKNGETPLIVSHYEKRRYIRGSRNLTMIATSKITELRYGRYRMRTICS